MKKLIILSAFLGFVATTFGQNGEIKGVVTDHMGKGLKGAHVDILDASGAHTGRGTVTDMDGRYTIDDLRAGTYDLEYSSPHCIVRIVKGILVTTDGETVVNLGLLSSTGKEIEVVQYVKPLINTQATRLEQSVAQEDIRNRDVNDIAAQQAGVEQRDAGSRISIEGSHDYEVLYMINGIPLMNTSTFFGRGRP